MTLPKPESPDQIKLLKKVAGLLTSAVAENTAVLIGHLSHTRRGHSLKAARLNLDSTLQGEFHQVAFTYLARLADQITSFDYERYRLLESKDVSKFYYLNRQQLPGIWTKLDSVVFSVKEPYQVGLWGRANKLQVGLYCICIDCVDPADNKAYKCRFFRLRGPDHLYKERSIYSLFLPEGLLQHVPTDLLSFDKYIDAFTINDNWYVSQAKNFEKMFKLNEVAVDQIQDYVDKVKAVIPLKNVNVFVDHLKKTKTYVYKLMAIVENDDFAAVDVTKIHNLTADVLHQPGWATPDGVLDCAEIPAAKLLEIIGDKYAKRFLSGKPVVGTTMENLEA